MAETRVKFVLDDQGAIEQLKRLNKQFDDFGKEIDKVFGGLVGKALDVAAAGIRLATAQAVEWVRQANEAEKIERRLASALNLRGASTASALERVKAMNTAIQQSIGISADSLAETQGTLLALGVMPEKLEEATRATVGLAQATGGELSGAAMTVARALQGNLQTLKRYGIEAHSAADANERLQELFRLAEAEAGTFDQRTKTLTENWGDFGEALGSIVTKSPELLRLLKDLGAFTADLVQDAEKAAPAARKMFDNLIEGVRGVGSAVRENRPEFEVLLQTLTRSAPGLRGAIDVTSFALGSPFRRAQADVALERPAPGALTGSDRLIPSPAEWLAQLAGESGTHQFEPTAIEATDRGIIAATARANREREKLLKERTQTEVGLQEAHVKLWSRVLMDGLRIAETQALTEAKIEESKTDLLATNVAWREEIRAKELADVEEFHRKATAKQEQVAASAAGALAQFSGIFGAFAQAISGAIQEQDFGAVIQRAVGQALMAWGTMLIQAGLVGAALGAIATFVPMGIPGPLLIGVSAAAGGIGAGVVALGHSMASGGGGARAGGSRSAFAQNSSGTPISGPGTAAFERGQIGVPPAFNVRAPSRRDSSGAVTNVTLNFGRGFVSGSPRRLAREVVDLLDQAGYPGLRATTVRR